MTATAPLTLDQAEALLKKVRAERARTNEQARQSNALNKFLYGGGPEPVTPPQRTPARATASPTRPTTSPTVQPTTPKPSASQLWRLLIEDYVCRGMSRTEAVLKAQQEQPDLHERYLAETNKERDGRLAAWRQRRVANRVGAQVGTPSSGATSQYETKLRALMSQGKSRSEAARELIATDGKLVWQMVLEHNAKD